MIFGGGGVIDGRPPIKLESNLRAPMPEPVAGTLEGLFASFVVQQAPRFTDFLVQKVPGPGTLEGLFASFVVQQAPQFTQFLVANAPLIGRFLAQTMVDSLRTSTLPTAFSVEPAATVQAPPALPADSAVPSSANQRQHSQKQSRKVRTAPVAPEGRRLPGQRGLGTPVEVDEKLLDIIPRDGSKEGVALADIVERSELEQKYVLNRLNRYRRMKWITSRGGATLKTRYFRTPAGDKALTALAAGEKPRMKPKRS